MHKKPIVLIGFFVLLIVLPFFMDDPYYLEILFLCNYYVILATTWDLLSGYTGNINLGYSFFVGSAAYAGALVNIHLGYPLWLALPIGGITASILGLIVGSFTLKLKGPYFAAVTFCFAALFYKITMISWQTFGGEEGLSGIDWLTKSSKGNYYFSSIFMILTIMVLYYISKSPFGLILKSIGQNEDVSEASGINTVFYKIVAVVITSFIAGLAGVMYGYAQMHVGPEMTHESLSILVVLMAVIGGMGTILGPVIGAYLLIIMNESLRFLGDMRLLIYSSLVLGVVLFSPRGLLPILKSFIERPFRSENKN